MKVIESKGYNILKELSSSKYSIVYLVEKDNEKYIIKKLTINDLFIKEFNMLNILKHPNICKIKDIFIEEYYYFLFDYYGDDLDIKFKNIYRLLFDTTEEVKKKWIFQLIDIISYIHSKGIVYQDLKPPNIVLDNNNIILIDFGMTQYENIQTLLSDTNIIYYPPEFHKKFEVKNTNKSTDIWMLGYVINFLQLKDRDLNLLIKEMMKDKPEDRICISDIINSEYFKQNYNKKDLAVCKNNFNSIMFNYNINKNFDNTIHITMFRLLNDWIDEVINEFKLPNTVKIMTKNNYNKFFNVFTNNNFNFVVSRNTLQLFGISLFYISASMYDTKLYKYERLSYLCGDAYNKDEINNMVNILLNIIYQEKELFYSLQ